MESGVASFWEVISKTGPCSNQNGVVDGMRQRKRVFVLLLALCIMTGAVPSFAAEQDGELLVTGKIAPEQGNNDKVTVLLLRPGYSYEDFKAGDADCLAGMEVAEPEYGGGYSVMFHGCHDDGMHTIVVQDGSGILQKQVNPMLQSSVSMGLEIHVSLQGDDAQDGTETSPVRTLERARELVRDQKRRGLPVDVVLHEGEYARKTAFQLGSEDSGSEGAPITYRAAAGERVVLKGTSPLSVEGFKTVTDEAVLRRLPETARGAVKQMNLLEQNLKQTDIYDMLHYYRGNTPAGVGMGANEIGIFLNGERQRLSRWPNNGYAKIGETNLGGQYVAAGGVAFDGPGGNHDHASFSYEEDAPARWQAAKDLCIEGYLGCEWAGEWSGVELIDPVNKKITLNCWTAYGVVEGNRWAAVNLLEEIDIPGEWYLDRNAMLLYYYPPYELDPFKDRMEITTLQQNLVDLQDAAYINFRNIGFQRLGAVRWSGRDVEYDGNAMVINGSQYIEITDCNFKNIGRNGIKFNGENILIDSCDFYQIAYNAVYMTGGGDRSALRSGNNVISNNHISDVGLIKSAGDGGIAITGGVGTVVEHNLIHNSHSFGINYAGNENLIRYNEVYRTNLTQNDAGAIYAGRSWSQYGSVVEYNYVHDLQKEKFTPDAFINSALYWDDTHSGNVARKNIIAYNDQTNSTFLRHHGGRDNLIEDNTVVNSLNTISATSGFYWLSLDEVKQSVQYQSLREVPYDQEPFLSKYPQMSQIYSDIDRDGTLVSQLTSSGNFSVEVAGNDINGTVRMTEKGTVSSDDMSVFVDPAKQDYRVKTEAKARMGLSDGILDENFDLSLIGLRPGYTELGEPFSLLAPAANAGIGAAESVALSWEKAYRADTYICTVAKDPEFHEIVFQEETPYQTAVAGGLQPATAYYWKVTAKNLSRQLSRQWDAVKNGVFYTADLPLAVSDVKVLQNGSQITSMTGAQGDATAEAVIVNYTGEPKRACAWLTQKTSAGISVGTVFAEVVVPAGEKRLTIPFTFIEGGRTLELFIWNGLEPLTAKTTVLREKPGGE